MSSPSRVVAAVRALSEQSASADSRLYSPRAQEYGVDYYNVRAGGRTAEDHPIDIRQMAHNETLKDEQMHHASDWHYFGAADWREYCAPLYAEHAPAFRSRPTLFVEFGSGVGAFARVVLRRFPTAAGVGVTLGAREVRTARQLMRGYEKAGRFVTTQADMTERPLPPKLAPLMGVADHVFIPGVYHE